MRCWWSLWMLRNKARIKYEHQRKRYGYLVIQNTKPSSWINFSSLIWFLIVISISFCFCKQLKLWNLSELLFHFNFAVFKKEVVQNICSRVQLIETTVHERQERKLLLFIDKLMEAKIVARTALFLLSLSSVLQALTWYFSTLDLATGYWQVGPIK